MVSENGDTVQNVTLGGGGGGLTQNGGKVQNVTLGGRKILTYVQDFDAFSIDVLYKLFKEL